MSICFLTSIATFAAEIPSLIKTEKLIFKLNKIISQQNKVENRKISNIVSNYVAVQCYNTDLTWEESYHRLENIQMIRGISKSKLSQLFNFIEEETFSDEEVVPETYRNCPLLTVEEARSSLFLSINVIWCVMLLYQCKKEKAVEQTNFTPTQKKKEKGNCLWSPCKKRSKMKLAKIAILGPYLEQFHQTFLHGSWLEKVSNGNSCSCYYFLLKLRSFIKMFCVLKTITFH